MTISSEEIKSIVLGLGADKCGIASAERFDDVNVAGYEGEYYLWILNLVLTAEL